jgi:hypothetical protein
MWLNQLKIAIVEKNTDKLDKLFNDIPELQTQEEIAQALTLTQEATSLVSNLKNETSLSMKQMKKNIDFLKSTQAPRSSRLDIKL